jgi:hypothetical protein
MRRRPARAAARGACEAARVGDRQTRQGFAPFRRGEAWNAGGAGMGARPQHALIWRGEGLSPAPLLSWGWACLDGGLGRGCAV